MTTKTKERPILFKSEMVRALLDGRKTQTRRVVKPQPVGDVPQKINCEWFEPSRVDRSGELIPGPMQFGFWSDDEDWKCPYGSPGERLYVRESARIISEPNDTYHAIQYKADKAIRSCRETNDPVFSCAGTFYKSTKEAKKEGSIDVWPWSPAMHVPKWASRITLEITDVRVERLQEISEEDAIAEGVHKLRSGRATDVKGGQYLGRVWGSARLWFRDLWDSINGKSEHNWSANPWVWVVEFKRIDN